MHLDRGNAQSGSRVSLQLVGSPALWPLAPVGGLGKRAFDLILAVLVCAVISPVLLAVGLLVKVTSRGPVLFWTERIGFGGALFWMPKFRTMRIDAPLLPREALTDADSLLTPIGGFLRRSSLDELPQLFCVLTGKMALVGPRPLLPKDRAAMLRLTRIDALRARPGITGLAQLRGRNFLSGERKVRYDEAYARLWSFGLDVQILFDTVLYVLRRKDVM